MNTGKGAAYSKPSTTQPKENATPSVSVAEPKSSTKKTNFKRTVPEETSRPAWFRMVGKKGGVWYKVRSNNLNVFDKETGRVRTLRYCPGENSVWLDEQAKESMRDHVVFREKNLVVTRDKPNLIKYLELHPDNIANGGSQFELVKREAKVEENLDTEFLISDAIEIIKKRSIEELAPVAYALRISLDQADRSVKHALVRYAKSNPQKFIDTLNSPMINTRATVKQAFDFNVIGYNGGAVIWADTRKIIVAVPVGQDKEEVMTRFCMTDAGSSALAEIERQLNDIA
jgi:hypothetical protein